MKIKVIFAAVCAMLTATTAAHAQDTTATATYGEITLNAGFTPDPYTVEVTAGGTIDAANIGAPCTGSIARAPDFQVTYNAGSLPFYIFVNSSSDTTLVVNGPDGLWYCDDDSNGGSNPQVTFNNPRSGTYDIWVGTYGGGTSQSVLHISELSTENRVPASNSAMPDTNLRATYGEVSLRAGFTPDPHRVSLMAGGNIPAGNVASGCTGSIARAPDYQIEYSAGALPLSIRTQSSSDTTLVVNGPDGLWYCDDDSAGASNAQVYFSKPSPGVYDIWVGTYSGGTTAAALLITETE
ncbi:peptidase [Brevundimonas lenta]|uniref:Peptidase S1 n=1 Tax=Brevundimonas lenta TaxID=424796 RepID=A0A7W6JFI6_9CAUL|nr:peptidase [Brevundimonas lenta]MBB4084187.1 hypothetical protein [Brevundimonas lenta]